MNGKMYDTQTGEEYPISKINDLDGFDYKSEGFSGLTTYILTQIYGLRHCFEEGRMKFGKAPEENHEKGIVILK